MAGLISEGAAARLPCLSGINMVRVVTTVLGVICVGIAVCVICGTIFTYFRSVFPLLMDPYGPAGSCNFVLAVWLSFNLIFNYVMVVRTPAGVPSCEVLAPDELRRAEEDRGLQHQKGEFTLWCQKCDAAKPPRAHHCGVCGVCVLKMDHHCPWVNACVGHYNHRYFVLFLLYLWLSVGYAVVTIALHWLGLLVNDRIDPGVVAAQESSVTLCFIVCIALFCVIGGFLGWSGFLILTNQTTIEYFYNQQQRREAKAQGGRWVNPFDCGRKRNVQQVVGPFRWVWQAALPSTAPLEFDGHHWPQDLAESMRYAAAAGNNV